MTTLLNPILVSLAACTVPQILMPALRQLEEAFVSAQKDPEFQAQFNDLLKNYAGRPTALTNAEHYSRDEHHSVSQSVKICCTAAHKLTRCSVSSGEADG